MSFHHNFRLFAAATVAATAVGTAQAQASNVSLYGILDANVSHITNVDGTDKNVTKLNSGGRNSSRWGLRGNEDLGGGLSAFFQLESDVSVDTGEGDSRLFGRLAYVGLKGSWGETRIGRDYAPIFHVGSSIEPLGCCRLGHGSFLSLGNAGAPNDDGRVSNSVAYWGKFGDVRTIVQYGFGETPGNAGAGRQIGTGAMYTQGNVHLAAAYHDNHVGSTGHNTSWVLGGRYTLGDLRVFAAYQNNKAEDFTTGTTRNSVMWTGAAYELTPAVELIGAVYRRDTKDSTQDATLFVLGANYKLSRRTDLYVDYGHVSNGDTGNFGVAAGATTLMGGSQAHTQLGIRHRF